MWFELNCDRVTVVKSLKGKHAGETTKMGCVTARIDFYK